MKLQLRALRIIFFGTKSFAAYHLNMLIFCSIHKIIAIFTQESQFCNDQSTESITYIAKAYNITLFRSQNLLMSEIANIIKQLNADIIVVVSYGSILSQDILNIPKFGCINVHGSLLPRWRGPAPIQRAIEFGDFITGISIIKMNAGIDTGNILCTKTCQILSVDTSYTLSKKLAQIGSILLLQIIEKIIVGIYSITPQNSFHTTTYAYKLKKEEARINWTDSVVKLERRIRAFNPWPVAYFHIKKNRIKVWNAKISNQNINNYGSSIIPGKILKMDNSGVHVATKDGILILTILQISGKRKTSTKNILNAYKSWFNLNTILQ